MQSLCCLCLCIPLIYFRMPEPIFMKLYVCITAPVPNSTACFINPSHKSVCLHVYPPIVVRQRLGGHVSAARNTRNNRTIIGASFSIQSVFYQRIVCESLCVYSVLV
jgi:hypothetical protein